MFKGDINGDGRIDWYDILLVQQHLLGRITLTPQEQERADINGDGEVTLLDLSAIQRHVSGIEIIIDEVI